METEALNSLRRGVYARSNVNSGAVLTESDVYFAMPYVEGQLESGQWMDGTKAVQKVKKDAPLMTAGVSLPSSSNAKILKDAIHDYKALLNEAGVVLNSEFQIEFSHHYGIENFVKWCVNYQLYQSRILQKNNNLAPWPEPPLHFHKRKEETFRCSTVT